MGMDLSTTIGPFIKISGDAKKTVIKIKRLCPNHPKKEQDGKFCTHCGTEIQNVEVPKVEKIYPMHLLQNNDSLWSPEGMGEIIMSNEYPPGNILIDDVVDLTDMDVMELKSKQIEWFKNEYQPEIDILRASFGIENIQVKWGLIQYWS